MAASFVMVLNDCVEISLYHEITAFVRPHAKLTIHKIGAKSLTEVLCV